MGSLIRVAQGGLYLDAFAAELLYVRQAARSSKPDFDAKLLLNYRSFSVRRRVRILDTVTCTTVGDRVAGRYFVSVKGGRCLTVGSVSVQTMMR